VSVRAERRLWSLVSKIKHLHADYRQCVLETAPRGSHAGRLGRSVVNGDSWKITCILCQLRVSVALEKGELRLAYDFDLWRKNCRCAHLEGPSACASFGALQEILRALPRSPKNH
jgi:hypothetical protein